MAQIFFLILFGFSSLAIATQRIPSFESKVINLTQFRSDQIKVKVVGETLHATLGAGNKVCTEVFSGYLPLVSDVFVSPEIDIPPCQGGWGVSQRARIVFYVDPIEGEYSFAKSEVMYETLPKRYPKLIALAEISASKVVVKMADSSDPLKWFADKNYPIFRLSLQTEKGSSILDHYQQAILHSSRQPEFKIEEMFRAIPNADADSNIVVVTEVGMFGIKKVYSRNQKKMKLSELKPYLENLVLTIKP